MLKKSLCFIVVLLLAICLISGGCSPTIDNKVNIKDWKDLLSLTPDKPSAAEQGKIDENNVDKEQELIKVKLYFVGPDGSSLVMEEREIVKSKGLARSTLQELVKGPVNEKYLPAVPEGTTLRDINLKPDGLCIVNLSSEARNVGSAQQEKLMVYAIANTLGQFATVKYVDFMIEGEKVETIAGFVDLSDSIKPNYNI